MDDTSQHARSHAWKLVKVSEMKTFLGHFFLTGIIHKPELEMYWCTDDMLATPYFNKVMPHNRFEIIWRFHLHFSEIQQGPVFYHLVQILRNVLAQLKYLHR